MNEIIIKTSNDNVDVSILELFEGIKHNEPSEIIEALGNIIKIIKYDKLEIDISIEYNNLTIINI